jgi:hypothetical protein
LESEREGERRIEVEMSFSSYSLTVSLSSSLSFPPLSPSSLPLLLPPNTQLDGLSERMRIFVTRMRLSGDGEAKEWLHLVREELKRVFSLFQRFFPPVAAFFPSSSLTSKPSPKKIQKQNKIQLNIQLLEAGLSVDTLQEG